MRLTLTILTIVTISLGVMYSIGTGNGATFALGFIFCVLLGIKLLDRCYQKDTQDFENSADKVNDTIN